MNTQPLIPYSGKGSLHSPSQRKLATHGIRVESSKRRWDWSGQVGYITCPQCNRIDQDLMSEIIWWMKVQGARCNVVYLKGVDLNGRARPPLLQPPFLIPICLRSLTASPYCRAAPPVSRLHTRHSATPRWRQRDRTLDRIRSRCTSSCQYRSESCAESHPLALRLRW